MEEGRAFADIILRFLRVARPHEGSTASFGYDELVLELHPRAMLLPIGGAPSGTAAVEAVASIRTTRVR
jgi:hypothetical protein